MKTNKTTTTISIGIAALLVPLSVFATGPGASLPCPVPGTSVPGTGVPGAISYGSINIQSGVNGNFSLGSNGTAMSYAHNSEAATAKVGATASFTPSSSTAAAGVSGETTSNSAGQAYNTSTGSGAGMAASYGSAATLVGGMTSIHGVTTGFNGGGSGTQTSNVIHAGTNQGSYVVGQTVSGFDAGVSYARPATITSPVAGIGSNRSATVSISAYNTGYASGANAMGALEGMNAAGLANIASSGQFFGRGALSATTGVVTAP
jgi:hypothetical protein